MRPPKSSASSSTARKPSPLRKDNRNPVRNADNDRKEAALLGLAFDNQDGQVRISRGKNFLLLGGNRESHSLMQETALKINEHLDKHDKRLEDLSLSELRDLCRRVTEKLR